MTERVRRLRAESLAIERYLEAFARDTVVMATHDSAIVDQMRKRVIELDSGQIVRDQVKGVYGAR